MRDLKFAFRQLLKHPGFTVISVLTLALGIGANTSMFSALKATLLRNLAYPEAGQLVRVFRTSPQSRSWPHSPANFLDHQSQNRVFTRMSAISWALVNFAEPGQPAERLRSIVASSDFFPLLGFQPILGRTFTAEEDRPGQNAVAVLNHGFWLRRFAGDTNIIGKTLRLDGAPVTVIGVMGANFHDSMLFGPIDIWRPIAFSDAQKANRGNNWLQSIARLKPGVSIQQAQVEMNALAARLARDYPQNNSEMGLRLMPLADAGMDDTGRRILWLTMGLTGFVLLIACVNLANLQFAHTAGRARELAIRGALGAPRGRLLRQLLTESLLIALLGGVLGLVIAGWGNAWLGRQIMIGDEPGVGLPLNLQVLGFALAITTCAGFGFGLMPAWLAARADVNDALKQGGRGSTDDRARHRLRHGLIIAEAALAIVLLAGAALFVRGLQRFNVWDPGWRVDGLTIGYVSLPDYKYGKYESKRAFTERLLERLANLPGVARAALAWSLPLWDFSSSNDFAIEGRPEPAPGKEPLRYVNCVSPGYFETMAIRRVAGRDFTSADTTNSPAVVIINEAMARTFWPGESPLGKRIGGKDNWQEIVGVVADVRFPGNIGAPDTPYQTYRPLTQAPRGFFAIAVRGNVPVETLRRVMSEMDPELPLNDPGSARAAVQRMLANYALTGWLLCGFAGLGLLLAGLGIYGVIAGFVAQRTGEIGVRLALGAQWGDVLWLVLGKGLRLTLIGVVLGVIGAFGIARLLISAAPELPSNDPLMIVAVALVLIGTAMLACWLPARRAAGVDPIVALRNE